MSTITINLPNDLNVKPIEIKMIIASKLYEDGRLSSSQAAEIVGLSKRAFIELLGQYGITVFGYDFEELQNDLKNV